jgi:FlaA1/EpsC-like NDP-sugar epimerase
MKTFFRKAMLAAADAVIVNVALFAALSLRFEGSIPEKYFEAFLSNLLILTIIKLLIYTAFRLYRSLWEYASISELIQLFMGTLCGSAASFIIMFARGQLLPRSVYFVAWTLTFLFIGASRFSYRVARKLKRYYEPGRNMQNRALIIGAGQTGSMVIKELRAHPELKTEPVVVVDKDQTKYNSSINGVPIKGGDEKIAELASKYNVNVMIIAVPSIHKNDISRLLKVSRELNCKLKMLPGAQDIMKEDIVDIRQMRDVNTDDLLGRDRIELSTAEIAGYLKNETVLVTGGGGSIGSELCRQIARFSPKKLIILDIYENNAYDLQNELLANHGDELDLEVLIGSVRDIGRLDEIFSQYRPGVVFHAAAHKHVPLMELNPQEAVKNNIIGTLNTARCAEKYEVRKFILISTDKAVNPTNIMGATKRMAEMIVQSMNRRSKTVFAAVRFGNVLGSNGSVIPLFMKQIANGGPVTVTHKEITRFFMTISEASQLVIQAGAMARGGEIFILDMGKPVKIIDLARDLIRMAGFEPDVDINIEFTGLRPGEKLYEELMLEEEGIDQTTHEKIFIGKLSEVDHNEVQRYVSVLEKNLNNVEKLKKCLKWAVPTYQPKKAQPPDEKPYRKEPEPEKQQVKMKIGMRRAAT